MSTKEQREGIAYLIRERQGVLQALRSDEKNPRILNDSIAAIDKQIATLQERREKLIFRRDNLPQLIAECKQQLRDLHLRRDKANPAVEQLLKLQAQMQLLQDELGDVDPEVLAMLTAKENQSEQNL